MKATRERRIRLVDAEKVRELKELALALLTIEEDREHGKDLMFALEFLDFWEDDPECEIALTAGKQSQDKKQFNATLL